MTFHLSPLEVGIGVEVLVSDYFDWPRPAASGNVHDAPLPNHLLLIHIKHTDPKLLLSPHRRRADPAVDQDSVTKLSTRSVSNFLE